MEAAQAERLQKAPAQVRLPLGEPPPVGAAAVAKPPGVSSAPFAAAWWAAKPRGRAPVAAEWRAANAVPRQARAPGFQVQWRERPSPEHWTAEALPQQRQVRAPPQRRRARKSTAQRRAPAVPSGAWTSPVPARAYGAATGSNRRCLRVSRHPNRVGLVPMTLRVVRAVQDWSTAPMLSVLGLPRRWGDRSRSRFRFRERAWSRQSWRPMPPYRAR